ncbi:MAG: hypothetical protein ABGZ24_00845, partial [Fuerstiella sp.]
GSPWLLFSTRPQFERVSPEIVPGGRFLAAVTDLPDLTEGRPSLIELSLVDRSPLAGHGSRTREYRKACPG